MIGEVPPLLDKPAVPDRADHVLAVAEVAEQMPAVVEGHHARALVVDALPLGVGGRPQYAAVAPLVEVGRLEQQDQRAGLVPAPGSDGHEEAVAVAPHPRIAHAHQVLVGALRVVGDAEIFMVGREGGDGVGVVRPKALQVFSIADRQVHVPVLDRVEGVHLAFVRDQIAGPEVTIRGDAVLGGGERGWVVRPGDEVGAGHVAPLAGAVHGPEVRRVAVLVGQVVAAADVDGMGVSGSAEGRGYVVAGIPGIGPHFASQRGHGTAVGRQPVRRRVAHRQASCSNSPVRTTARESGAAGA